MVIPVDSLWKMYPYGLENYFADHYLNEGGEVVEIVFRRGGNSAQLFQQKIKEAYNESPELRKIKVDCADQANLLNDVYRRDQFMKRGITLFDLQVDHQNFEILASFLDKCGIPSLKEVNKSQMRAIYLVMEQADKKYQRKYLPMLDTAAKKGDIDWNFVARMKERLLFNGNGRQIFGVPANE